MPSVLIRKEEDLEGLCDAAARTTDEICTHLDGIRITGTTVIELGGVVLVVVPYVVSGVELAELGAGVTADFVSVAAWCGFVCDCGAGACYGHRSCNCGCFGGSDRNAGWLGGCGSCAGWSDC